jgi:hypothetical protein
MKLRYRNQLKKKLNIKKLIEEHRRKISPDCESKRDEQLLQIHGDSQSSYSQYPCNLKETHSLLEHTVVA